MLYRNRKTGELITSDTYYNLTTNKQLEFSIDRTGSSSNHSDTSSSQRFSSDRLIDTGISAAIGYATGSALLGGLIGGDIVGGILGDLFEGDGLMD